MKFYTSAIILAFAATVLAAPTEIERGWGDGGGGGGGGGGGSGGGGDNISTGSACKQNSVQVCCSGLLNCLVQGESESCTSNQYCCETSAPVGGLVNVALLNCVNIL